ncbi:MAG: VOC family protein, partial [Thermoleophilaceae bacterium]|nr:VOC family protein [Thermoleophilaceae bacterium]
GLAAVAFVPVGALVLSDGLRELEASSTAWAAARGVALASVVAVGLAALMVKLAAQSVVQPGLSTHKAWAEARPLPFGGRSSSGRSPARTCDPGTSSPTAVGSPDGCSRTRHSISARAEQGRPGAGTVHHVAWASTIDDHPAWRDRAREGGARPTEVIDRFWFRSIYFVEPSGVLFEIASMDPGFDTDEDPDHLGEKLVLPPRFEPMRERIEATLTPLSTRRG